MKTSPTGSAASMSADVVVRGSSIRFARSARKPASARTKSSLPNSDGWKRNEPTSSQRRDPRVTGPAAKTSNIVPTVPM
jgi:hypothetical protein